MSSCIQEAFLLKDLSSSLSLYLSFCVSLSSSWSPPDEPWCSPRSDDVWYVSGSAQIAEMWLFIDDRLTDWRRRRRRRRRRKKATVRSAPDGSDNNCQIFSIIVIIPISNGGWVAALSRRSTAVKASVRPPLPSFHQIMMITIVCMRMKRMMMMVMMRRRTRLAFPSLCNQVFPFFVEINLFT